MSQLVTGEAVEIELRAAKLASRAVAAVLDMLLQLVLLWGLFYAVARGGIDDSALAAAVFIVIIVLVFIGYPVICETLGRGRSVGKLAMGLRVVRDDGGPVRLRHSLARALLWIVDVPLTMGSAAVISSLASVRGKRLGDQVAGTFVLQERVPARAVVPIMMPAPLAPWAEQLDLSRLPSGLALAVRDFLTRSHELTPVAREQIGRQLTEAVVAAISPPPPPDAPGWAVLAAVLAERRRRDEHRLQSEAAARAASSGAGPSGWSAGPAAVGGTGYGGTGHGNAGYGGTGHGGAGYGGTGHGGAGYGGTGHGNAEPAAALSPPEPPLPPEAPLPAEPAPSPPPAGPFAAPS